jgi:hypothetical protein
LPAPIFPQAVLAPASPACPNFIPYEPSWLLLNRKKQKPYQCDLIGQGNTSLE